MFMKRRLLTGRDAHLRPVPLSADGLRHFPKGSKMKRYRWLIAIGVLLVLWGVTILELQKYQTPSWWGFGLSLVGMLIILGIAFCDAEAVRRGWRTR